MAEPRARRAFGPVVLLGLASGGLAAVSASKAWVAGSTASAAALAVSAGDHGESPLALALALVLLATWGVVLVTRRRFRLVVAILGAAAALGYAVTTALAPWQLRDALERAVLEATGTVERDASVTAWWWAAVVAAVLACAASAACVAWVRQWPEMGAKYDNPATGHTGEDSGDAPVPTENIDIWKALDEGRDPTA